MNRLKDPAERARAVGTVLLVEDDAAVRALSRRVLERAGYSVLEAGDGERALELATVAGPSIEILFTDVLMPNMNGRQLADRMGAPRPGLAVLYTSGFIGNTDVPREDLPRGIGFLGKPFTPGDLVQKVQAMLGPRTGEEPEPGEGA